MEKDEYLDAKDQICNSDFTLKTGSLFSETTRNHFLRIGVMTKISVGNKTNVHWVRECFS